MKIMIIMRGWPGSGKSTVTRRIKAQFPEFGIYSTDSFFHDEDGNYRFDPLKLAVNHKRNKEAVEAAAKLGHPIIVDNTNTKKWEYESYVNIGNQNGYKVYQYVCTGTYHNKHGVPDDKVEQMKANFETDNTLPLWTVNAMKGE